MTCLDFDAYNCLLNDVGVPSTKAGQNDMAHEKGYFDKCNKPLVNFCAIYYFIYENRLHKLNMLVILVYLLLKKKTCIF